MQIESYTNKNNQTSNNFNHSFELGRIHALTGHVLYDKRDDFNSEIVNFPFLDGVVPRHPSYGVYISQLIRFARVRSHVDDFNTRDEC